MIRIHHSNVFSLDTKNHSPHLNRLITSEATSTWLQMHSSWKNAGFIIVKAKVTPQRSQFYLEVKNIGKTAWLTEVPQFIWTKLTLLLRLLACSCHIDVLSCEFYSAQLNNVNNWIHEFLISHLRTENRVQFCRILKAAWRSFSTFISEWVFNKMLTCCETHTYTHIHI